MKIDEERKKELRKQYENRHPDKGIVTLKSKDQIFVMTTVDANADYNGLIFQLKLGSWPCKELQNAYSENPDAFEWCIETKLEYEDQTKDYSDDLTLMLMEYMEKHPDAKPMKPARR